MSLKLWKMKVVKVESYKVLNKHLCEHSVLLNKQIM